MSGERAAGLRRALRAGRRSRRAVGLLLGGVALALAPLAIWGAFVLALTACAAPGA